MKSCDLLIKNSRIAAMDPIGNAFGSGQQTDIAIDNGKIIAIGPLLEQAFMPASAFDVQGLWLTPGLIDCHTHIVYGGNRANEFEARLQGQSYAEIAQAGGGINGTVKQTRLANKEELLESALRRARRLCEEGVTTLEVKSGYGLSLESEIRILEVARSLTEHLPAHITTTFLGAHCVPQEFNGNADGYIDLVCEQMIPEIAKRQLADAVDLFCETVGFNLQQSERVLAAARQYGLAVKAHVEQLTDSKGARLASQYQALSVDHLEYLATDDVAALSEAGTVAVLLPGAFYYLNETQKPPIEALRNASVAMAVATDLNPGTSPLCSLHTAMNMACVLFGLTPQESWLGVTRHAAKALGMANKGSIAVGMDADLLLWDFTHPRDLCYQINGYRPVAKWLGGRDV